MTTKDTCSAMRAKKEELREAGDIAARKPFMLRRKFGDPQYAPLDWLWSSADAYLDLAASAIDAAEYFENKQIMKWTSYSSQNLTFQSVRCH